MNKVTCNDAPQERQIQVGDLIKIGEPFDNVYIAARVGMNQLSLIGLDHGNRFNCDPLPEKGESTHKVFIRALGGSSWSFVNSVTITRES